MLRPREISAGIDRASARPAHSSRSTNQAPETAPTENGQKKTEPGGRPVTGKSSWDRKSNANPARGALLAREEKLAPHLEQENGSASGKIRPDLLALARRKSEVCTVGAFCAED
jgi:hypothetical protein